jgi:hypothetical protein
MVQDFRDVLRDNSLEDLKKTRKSSAKLPYPTHLKMAMYAEACSVKQ